MADHRALADRTTLTLGAPPRFEVPVREAPPAVGAQAAFAFGRYLLMASSRPGAPPANLQGVWNDQLRPPWSSNYTLNINLEMAYWAAESVGLAECREPLVDLVGLLAAQGRRVAAELYGCRGWVAHHNSDVWGWTLPVGGLSGDPSWADWAMGGVWLCRHLPDDERARAPAGGGGAVLPRLARRGRPVAHHVAVDVPRERLPDADRLPRAEHGLDHGPRAGPRPVRALPRGSSPDRSVATRWPGFRARRSRPTAPCASGPHDAEPVDPHHRHLSHLVGLYPLAQIDPQSTPDLAAAAARTLDARGPGSTGWSLAWKAALRARLGDGAAVGALLAEAVRPARDDGPFAGGLLPNLFSTHPPFQVDGNLGLVAAVVEALVQSHTDDLRILPALPPGWPDGELRGAPRERRCHGRRDVVGWSPARGRAAPVGGRRPHGRARHRPPDRAARRGDRGPARGVGGMTFEDLTRTHGLLYGGDYNPEQWPADVWPQDVALMREAGVNLVTVGVFSWASLEPAPGELTWDWLDQVLDLLHEGGILVDLATPSASPPPWLARLDPTTSSVDAAGVRMSVGSRNHFCPSSPVFRDCVASFVSALVDRYADHPAVAMWHVGNEFGQTCFCDLCAERFRTWLEVRYGDLDGLNRAWGTAFWSQRYGAWDEIVPPRAAPYVHNPTQVLDFRRFTSDQLRDVYRLQSSIIRAASSAPVTTNAMGFFREVDQHSWADDLDVVADDHYADPADPDAAARAALAHDLTRGVGHGKPWALLEQAAGAVSWRPHNLPKSPGGMLRDSLRAVAHGADAVCYFQWRASPLRRRAVPLGAAPARRPGHRPAPGRPRAGSRAEPPAVCRRHPGGGPGRARLRLAVVVGGGVGRPPERPARRAGPARGVPRAVLAGRHRDRRGAAGCGPGRLRPRRGAAAPPRLRRRRGQPRAGHRAGGVLLVGPFSGIVDQHQRVRQGRFPVPWSAVLGVSGRSTGRCPTRASRSTRSVTGPSPRPCGRST